MRLPQSVVFADMAVMVKPPSLAKRRGVQTEEIKSYRILFSLWCPRLQTRMSAQEEQDKQDVRVTDVRDWLRRGQ